MLSIYPNSIQSSALPKLPLTTGAPRKQMFQEDEYTDFLANDIVSKLNYITKQDCAAGYLLKDMIIKLCWVDRLQTNFICQK